jgi:hypothetical protein
LVLIRIGYLGEDVWDGSLRVVLHLPQRRIDILMNDFPMTYFQTFLVCVGDYRT